MAQATGLANATKEQAEGEAQATLTKAKAQAQANELLARSVTPPLIQYEQLQRWDGRLPMFLGAAGTPLLDLAGMVKTMGAGSPAPPSAPLPTPAP